MGVVRSLILTVIFWGLGCTAKYIKYNTTSSRHPTMLNVHIISHSHDDVGWLKTIDQYYYGANTSIQAASVQMIFDSVLLALQQNKDRQFTFAEMAFFYRWWSEASDQDKQVMRNLFGSGQAMVWNGGWVQHDEATAHYTAMIDQTTRGHRFLKSELGFIPRIGFQADPFGHSSTNAALLTGAVGLQGTLFGRADYQDVDRRRLTKETEMVWRGSESLGAAGDAFTVNLDGYWPIPGFWWEFGLNQDDVMRDDLDLTDYNVESRVDDFVHECMNRFAYTRGNDIIVTMGSDFHYANAFHWYKNLDKLIHHVNLDGRLNVFYSNASYYFKSKAAYNVSWPLKTDDFFPYADSVHAYWTGYFTSRPTSKGFIRMCTAFLQAVRQLEALTGRNASESDALEDAVSLTQHHDSITGTEKQHVANDYHMRLYKGLERAQREAAELLAGLVSGEGSVDCSTQQVDRHAQPDTSHAAQRRLHSSHGSHDDDATAHGSRDAADNAHDSHDVPDESQGNAQLKLEFCQYLNVSACGPSVGLSRLGKPFLVVVYNPLAWEITSPVRVPVAIGVTQWKVTDADDEVLPSQLVPVSSRTVSLQSVYITVGAIHNIVAMGDHELVFTATLPPLGYVAFTVSPADGNEAGTAVPSHVYNPAQHELEGPRDGLGSTYSVTNGVVELTFSQTTGHLESLSVGNITSAVRMQYVWYKSSDGSEKERPGQCSGAYIFRPQGLYNVGPGYVTNEVVKGPVLTEVRQTYADWAVTTLRLWHGSRHVEVEWTVGPIPVEDSVGKEISLQYISDVDSGDVFYTDSNGRDMLKRVRDKRPTWDLQVNEPVAGNYYPLTAAMYIEDAEEDGRQLAVTIDRAQGGTSMSSGTLELMVHRRTVHDDWRGVNEDINENECGCRGCDCVGLTARGVHYLALTSCSLGSHVRRSLQQMLNDPPLVAIGAAPQNVQPHTTQIRRVHSGLVGGTALAANVHLQTLMPWADNSLLVRLAHVYQVGEVTPHNLSSPVSVSLGDIIPKDKIRIVSELSLSANQCRSEMEPFPFKAGEPIASSSSSVQHPPAPPPSTPWGCAVEPGNSDLEVVLNPMEIRTFQVFLK